MAKETVQQRLVAALTALGCKQIGGKMAQGCLKFSRPNSPKFFFVGSGGSLRTGTTRGKAGTIDQYKLLLFTGTAALGPLGELRRKPATDKE